MIESALIKPGTEYEINFTFVAICYSNTVKEEHCFKVSLAAVSLYVLPQHADSQASDM